MDFMPCTLLLMAERHLSFLQYHALPPAVEIYSVEILKFLVIYKTQFRKNIGTYISIIITHYTLCHTIDGWSMSKKWLVKNFMIMMLYLVLHTMQADQNVQL